MFCVSGSSGCRLRQWNFIRMLRSTVAFFGTIILKYRFRILDFSYKVLNISHLL